MHICVSKLNIIDSNNGLAPDRQQAIFRNQFWDISIWPLGTTFSEMSLEIHTFSFNKMDVKMSSATILSWPQYVNLRFGDLLPCTVITLNQLFLVYFDLYVKIISICISLYFADDTFARYLIRLLVSTVHKSTYHLRLQ